MSATSNSRQVAEVCIWLNVEFGESKLMARSTGKTATAMSAKQKGRTRLSLTAVPPAQKPRPRRADGAVKIRLSKAVKANLGAIQTLAEFLSDAGKLTPANRLTIIEQALVMIDQTYVHLPLKRAMHAIEPVQRLRLVKQRAGALYGARFP